MAETTARLLRLLSLLQTRRDWTGAELAERLDVAPRTVRRDIDRLRELGYPVDADRGVAGGYRLGAGAEMPPLLIEDDEAVAIAVGLRSAAGGSIAGIEESSVRALAKLERVLPDRVRRKVTAIQTFTVSLPGQGPTVEASVLTLLSAACRDRESVRFTYRTGSGDESRRLVEPVRLAHSGQRWYLLAWDGSREDWRIFRVDRIQGTPVPAARFAGRPEPEGGADQFLSTMMERWLRESRAARAVVGVSAPAVDVRNRIPRAAAEVEDDGRGGAIVRLDIRSLQWTAAQLVIMALDLEAELRVLEGDELRATLAQLSERFAAAADH